MFNVRGEALACVAADCARRAPIEPQPSAMQPMTQMVQRMFMRSVFNMRGAAWKMLSGFLSQQGDAGGVAVDEVLPADWTDLARGKKAGHGRRGHRAPGCFDVVRLLRKHVRSPSVAT